MSFHSKSVYNEEGGIFTTEDVNGSLVLWNCVENKKMVYFK